MADTNSSADLKIGAELSGPVRLVTPQRVEWYDSAMLSAALNELAQVGSNIHTDEEYARAQGLPSANADGMIMTNWCSSMMVKYFGMDYLTRGELRTKYIKPVPIGAVLHVRGRVRGIQPSGDGQVFDIEIWCEDENGTKLVDGDAKVPVRAAA